MKADTRARNALSPSAARCSAFPWPYWCSRSAGRTATRNAKSVSSAATRSVPEWAASASRPSDPVSRPAASLIATRKPAAPTEIIAVRTRARAATASGPAGRPWGVDSVAVMLCSSRRYPRRPSRSADGAPLGVGLTTTIPHRLARTGPAAPADLPGARRDANRRRRGILAAHPTRGPRMIRVVIADDHNIVRTGLSHLLARADDITVVGLAASGREAVETTIATGADVVLMDLSMPDVDGIAATREIVAQAPDTRVVVLTSFVERTRVIDALDAGAIGYLLKDTDPEELVRGIRAAARGE